MDISKMKKPELVKLLDPYIEANGVPTKKGLFRCFCGKEFICRVTSVKTGRTKSCGCYLKHITRERETKHNLSGHKLYFVWYNMMDRCYTETSASFKWYGGNGIQVCKRWHNVENFFKDMIDTYKPGLTLERKNSKRNYSQRNCKWAGWDEQSRNKSSNHYVEFNGISKTVTDWSLLLGGVSTLVANRLDRGWSIERALTTLPKTKHKKEEKLTYKGETKGLLEWAKEYGIRSTTLAGRLYRCGWTIEEALTTPIQKHKPSKNA